MNLYRPIIIGIAGSALTESEQSWLTELKPYGIILFSRNIDNPSQLKALCTSLRHILGDDVVIVIDQEGGRVQRLKQPDWPQLPAALDIGKLWRKHQFKGLEAANSLGQVIGSQLASAGISHVAAPVLDLSIDGADPVIGDRAFGTTPAEVIPLATAFIDGVICSGVTPIMKHIPGMGRADMDSHQSLPLVQTPVSILEQSDWIPFKIVSGTRWAMTAHIVIPEWDHQPITTSKRAITKIRSLFGDRIIVSDCLTMGAITGTIRERIQQTLDAGVDLALFSNGSDADRRHAVEACGKPSVVREEPAELKSLPNSALKSLLRKLREVPTPILATDPTRDQRD
jgi:beta-N-acetylhexosaminidase